MRMVRHVLLAVSCAVVMLTAAVAPGFPTTRAWASPPPAGFHHGVPEVATAGRSPAPPGPPSALQRAAMHGALPFDARTHAAAKAAANAAAHGHSPANTPARTTPAILGSSSGLYDPNWSPPDATGAIGTTRYVELVNSTFGIYDRTATTPLITGTMNALTGAPATSSVFDVQVLWDPASERFYYAADEVVNATTNNLDFGYSTTGSPGTAADWCHYTKPYGADFPDYPKLGDGDSFITIGSNVFPSSGSTHTNLDAFLKPANGTTDCAASLSGAQDVGLTNPDGSVAWTPVPANDIEGAGIEYVVAVPSGGGNSLSLFAVQNSNGTIVFSNARSLTVRAWSPPADVPQPSPARFPIDTLDGRATQAVEAVDPSQSGQLALWTQHTVFGGAGAEVRWYEINPTPSTPVPFQSGTQTSSSVDVFNAAIAPDRRVNGTARKFGDAIVLGFNTGSATQPADVESVTKIGSGATVGPVVVTTSNGPVADFGCNTPEHPGACRWGDYAAATPDPASDVTQSHGVVWLTNEYVVSGKTTVNNTHSWNWSARPAPK